MIFWRLSTLWLTLLVSCGTSAKCIAIITNTLGNRTAGNLNLILTLSNSVAPVLEPFKSKSFPTHEARVQAVTTALKNATAVWQAPVLAALKPFNVETISFWVTNQIFVKSASPTVVTMLKGLGGLEKIAEDITIPLLPIFDKDDGQDPKGEPQWGVKKINAHLAWEKYNRGLDIILGLIDTGVNVNHKDLKDNYVGTDNCGWYDPLWCTKTPEDRVGHGTHCAGIMVGRNGIGVAPDARFMICRACYTAGCPESALLACAQFYLCPTDVEGENPGKCKRPQIVSNSWGGDQNQPWFNKKINAWVAAGIIPFFAIGNDGPECNTTSSPGDQPKVISVGSTNIMDQLSTYSSRGPNFDGEVKMQPFVAAPGEKINSASSSKNDGYRIYSGTSMATPLVAGAVALLLSKNPSLSQDDIKLILKKSAVCIQTELKCGTYETGKKCPNNEIGVGRLDILEAFNQMPTNQGRLNATEMQVYR